MSLPEKLHEGLEFLRGEIHHFPVALQAKVVELCEDAWRRGHLAGGEKMHEIMTETNETNEKVPEREHEEP